QIDAVAVLPELLDRAAPVVRRQYLVTRTRQGAHELIANHALVLGDQHALVTAGLLGPVFGLDRFTFDRPREPHQERGPLPGRAFRDDGAAMRRDDAFDDR